MIFETERLLVRKLSYEDLPEFHNLESNPKVLQYADGSVKSFAENKIELHHLIKKYSNPKNDFWIYAIVTKNNQQFIGTLAFVKNNNDDEIGYRFLQDKWGLGYGSELCFGIVHYAKRTHFKRLVAFVDIRNIASYKILEKAGFTKDVTYTNVKELQELKYQFIL